jgi:GNAT superfamily N-acetyltransferase
MTGAPESGRLSAAELCYAVATVNDRAAALRLLDEACDWVHSKGIAWVRRYPRGCVNEAIKRREFFLVSLASEPVATFTLTEQRDPCWEARGGSALYLHAFAVCRKHAGQGLGRQILDWATETAGRRGMQYLRLDCSAANAGLRQYYLNAGLTSVEGHPAHPWPALFQRECTYRVGDSKDERVHE